MAALDLRLLPFQAPEWMRGHLTNIPKYRLKLAMLDTPIQEWKIGGVPGQFSLAIKRDDLTGCALSGNKVRKLEFLLARALEENCHHVITSGNIQSNHCRTTAVTAAQLGLQAHLLIRTELTDPDSVGCKGNLLFDRMAGAHMYLVPRRECSEIELKSRMELLAENIRKKTGEKSYLIPVGGSDEVGVYGYLKAFEEMIKQGLLENFDDLVFACGSGGTSAGLAVANYLNGSRLRLHGIVVSDNAKFFHNHINMILPKLGMNDTRSEEIVNFIEGYKGLGYALSREEELDFFAEIMENTGIAVDPIYNGKAVRGMMAELQNRPEIFKGNRILFLHTGGLYALFDGRMDPVLKRRSHSNRVKAWLDINDPPPYL